MKLTNILLAALVTTLATSAGAQADTISLTESQNTQYTNQFAASGLSIATETAGGTLGISEADYYDAPSNSVSGQYPTTEFLNFNFATPISVSSFNFYDEGTELGSRGVGTSSYTAFNSMGGIVGTGTLNGVDGTVTTSLSNVSLLQFSNGLDGSDPLNPSWIFDVSSITVSSAPEPSTYACLLLGMAGLATFLKYRKIRS